MKKSNLSAQNRENKTKNKIFCMYRDWRQVLGLK